MKLKRQKIFFELSKITLPLLYIPFFIVQIFFNFDTPFPKNARVVITANKHVASQKTTTSFHPDKAANKEGNIRLNKRFQPENAPVILPPVFEVAAYLVTADIFYNYPGTELSSSHLLVNKLRGPPVVV